MSTEDRKLDVEQLTDFELEGEGTRLTLKFSVYRQKKTKRPERTHIAMTMTRHSLDRLLSQIQKMHVRDRIRLKREERRISDEIRSLTEEAT